MYVQATIFSRSHTKLADIEMLSSVQRSFALNGIGQARLVTSAKSPLYAAGIIEVGNIITITGDTGIAPWGGWITRLDQTAQDLTITCKEMAYVFSRRRLGKSEFFPYKSPADLVKQLTAQTNPFVITDAASSDTTTPFSKEFHFTGGAAALKRLPIDTGVDWWVQILPNGQGVLHTGNRGQDLTESVIFAEGTNIVDPVTYSRDGEALINNVIFVGRGDGAWETAPHKESTDHASVTQFGLYAAVNVRYDVVHASELGDVSRRYLERNSRPVETLDFHLANVNGIWGQFGVGDTVTIYLPSFGPTGLNVPARIVGLEIDEYNDNPLRVLSQII